MSNTCFISGEEGPVSEILCDGKVYFISEKLTDEHPVKAIKKMITDKIDSDKNAKTKLITKIEDMAKSMGVSKDELIKILGGKVPTENEQSESALISESSPLQPSQPQSLKPQSQQPKKISDKPVDDGFKAVDGSLKSSNRTSMNIESGAGDYVTPAVPAYSSVKTKDNKTVIETNKKVKTVDNVLISKSDMGTTAIAVAPNDVNSVNRIITAVDKQTNSLIRAGASGRENSAKECPVCKGSGITVINNKVCIKCNGSGFIFI